MDAQSQPISARSVTFASYVTRRRGRTTKPQRRFFAHRRALLYAEMGDSITEVAKLIIERCVRAEWLLIQIDRRIDAGERLSVEELQSRNAMDSRLRADLSKLMPKKRAAPAPAASKPAPAPKTEAPKKAQSLDEYLTSKRAEAPVP